MKKILLVEDSLEFQKVVLKTFPHFTVVCVESVSGALEALHREAFDLVLLDIGLPTKSGYALLSELRASTVPLDVPVICLTGRTEIQDKVTAFSLGADDYILKPFEPLELRARVEAKIEKRNARQDTKHIRAGLIDIDSERHRVSINEGGASREVRVIQTEFKLLSTLAKTPGRVFSRDQLLVAVWGEDAHVNDRVVDVHLCSLRKKLGKHGRQIEAVTGFGYRFQPVTTAANKAA